MSEPFMEHPSGEFDSVVEAMVDAIKRLRELPEWYGRITFCAQGMGPHVDSYHFAEIALRHDEFELDEAVDPALVTQQARVGASCLVKNGQMYSLLGASPAEAARILDAIFRFHLGIRPHAGEGDDYAIGAEWEEGE